MDETLFAHLAFIILDADVNFHVIDIVTRRIERFFANFAFVWTWKVDFISKFTENAIRLVVSFKCSGGPSSKL